MTVLLYGGAGLIAAGYLYFIYVYFTNRNKKTKKNSLDLIIKSFDNNSINFVEVKGRLFSSYNVERGLVKLTSRSYDKNDNFSLAVASLLSGYANNKNRFLIIVGKIIREVRIISFLPLIVLLLIFSLSSVMDFKIGIFFLIIILVYQYLFDLLNGKVVDDFNDKDEGILKVLKSFKLINSMFFIGTLIELVRYIVMLFWGVLNEV